MSASSATASPAPVPAAAPRPAPSSWRLTAAVVLLLTAALSVLLTAFAWPAVRSGLHDLPIAVAGPAPATAQVQATLTAQRPGAFSVRALPDEAAAVAAIRDRTVYGAIVVGSGGPTVLTASAASPAVAQALQQLAVALGGSEPAPGGSAGSGAAGEAPGVVRVRDVVPLPADDMHGAGLAAGALPLVIGGIAIAVVLTLRVRGSSRRLVAAASVSVLGGLALAGLLQGWIGSLSGSYPENAGVVALALAAVSFTLLGLEWLAGLAGLGLGAAVMILLGNPLSGLTSAPELLPAGWGTLGQLLPPGATGTLLRSVSFFDGAGSGRPLAVLLGWLALGLVLCGIAATRAAAQPAPVPR